HAPGNPSASKPRADLNIPSQARATRSEVEGRSRTPAHGLLYAVVLHPGPDLVALPRPLTGGAWPLREAWPVSPRRGVDDPSVAGDLGLRDTRAGGEGGLGQAGCLPDLPHLVHTRSKSNDIAATRPFHAWRYPTV